MGIIRKWDTANKEIKDKCLGEVIARVEEIDGESVGLIAAGEIIDIVTDNLGPEIYNKAIRDVKKLLEERSEDTMTELDLLQIQG